MSNARKDKEFTAYADSFLAIELKQFDSFLADLLKNESDEKAKKLITDIRDVIKLVDYTWSQFDKGNVPGAFGKTKIVANAARYAFTFKSLSEQVTDFYFRQNASSDDALNSRVGEIFYIVIIRTTSIIAKLPKTVDSLIPFLNLEGLIKEFAPTQNTEAKTSKVQIKNTPKEENLLSELFRQFPTLDKVLNQLNNFEQIGTDGHSEIAQAAPSLINEYADIGLQLITKMFSLFPLNQIHDRIQTGNVDIELRNEIQNLKNQAIIDFNYFNDEFKRLNIKLDMELNKWKLRENERMKPRADFHEPEELIYHRQATAAALGRRNLCYFFLFLCLMQENKVNALLNINAEKISQIQQKTNNTHYTGYESSAIYLSLDNILNHLIDLTIEHENNVGLLAILNPLKQRFRELTDHTAKLFQHFSAGRIPTPTEWLRIHILLNSIDSSLTEIKNVITQSLKSEIPAELPSVYLSLLMLTNNILDELPKELPQLLGFANISRLTAPFVEYGVTTDKIQSVVTHIASYEKYLPDLKALTIMKNEVDELKKISNDVKEHTIKIQISKKYTKLITEMNSKIQNLESQIAEKIKSNNPENYTDLTLALLISVKIKSEAENDFSILRASKINSASTFNQNTLTLLNELKRESEELDARVKENEAAIKAANSKIESLSTQKSANTNKLSRITAYIEKYNTILKSHENDFPIFRKENIEKELNEKASVAELHDLIPDHNYKNWSGESAGALSSAMSKAKLELSKTAQRLQKSIDAISAGIQKANNIIDETSKRLADVNHDIAKIIEDAQSSLEYAKDDDNAPLKAVAPTPPEFITMIAPDENINRVLRAEAWKTNMDEYFTRRNRTYFIRDFIGNIVAKIVRFFGPTSYQSEYEKRHAFKADFNSALRVYAVDNNETVLRTAINTGLTHFKPGTDESSTAYFTTMKSHLETINQEFNDSLKP